MNTVHKHLFITPLMTHFLSQETKSIVPEQKLQTIREETFLETLDEPYTLKHLYQEILAIPEQRRKNARIQMKNGSIILHNFELGYIYKFIFEEIDSEYVYFYQCKVDRYDVPLKDHPWKKFKTRLINLRENVLNTFRERN